MKNFIGEKEKFRGKTKAELVTALEARGVKKKGGAPFWGPKRKVELNADLREAVDAVKGAAESDIVSKLESLAKLVVESDPGITVKNLIAKELPCRLLMVILLLGRRKLLRELRENLEIMLRLFFLLDIGIPVVKFL